MSAHRDLAIAAMQYTTQQSIQGKDFVVKAGLCLPGVQIPGSLKATLRTQVGANDMKLAADLVLNWTIGDYPGEKDYSAYYDPKSPWYNVFFGGYAIRSYKLDGSAWGYGPDGEPDFDEFFEIPKIDYNNFTAGQFGCPPEKMCFQVQKKVVSPVKIKGWDVAQVDASVPSGLHIAAHSLGEPYSYVVYGIPNNDLLEGREPYERLEMHGQMYMRQVPPRVINRTDVPQPVTMAFGALCRDDEAGRELLDEIMTALTDTYLSLYPEQ